MLLAAVFFNSEPLIFVSFMCGGELDAFSVNFFLQLFN
jgi:hypothetical protein